MVMITLLDENSAKVGFEFIFMGPIQNCKDCKLKNVCFNLDIGGKYRVTKVREKKHQCKVHMGNVMVVEVEKVPLEICVDTKSAIEGSMVMLGQRDCMYPKCENYRRCFPLGVRRDAKFKVKSVGKKANCAMKYNLSIVTVE
ncbi:MAG: hypothetical protein DRN20_00970 [Thermoplasmata archaeon]|nr:MAG: hypothetical protein DRN20_00970 [Thermoplasmata archaeon]